jgi:tight adherence protein B
MNKSKAADLLAFAADLELLASSLGAGLQLEEASGYLTRHGSEVHRSHWQKLVSRLNAQLPLLVALHDFKVSAADFWADQLCEIIITCEVYNSTLVSSEVVKLARSVRQVGDFKADSQRRLNAAKGVAWLALASPWILLLLLCGRPENREYFLEPQGIALLVAGGAASVASYFISKSIASIPITRRVFA